MKEIMMFEGHPINLKYFTHISCYEINDIYNLKINFINKEGLLFQVDSKEELKKLSIKFFSELQQVRR